MTSTIYKIYCKDNEITEVYVGSTDDFHTRCNNHNNRCHNENSKDYNYKVYEFIRANGGMDNWIIEEIIQCEEDTRYDAEVHYFKTLNSKLNTRFPRRTKKEYYLDNKEEILEKRKEYYLDNKERFLEKRIKIVCDCGSIVTTASLKNHYKSQKHIRYLETIE